MSKVVFLFNGLEIIIPCNKDEKLKECFEKYGERYNSISGFRNVIKRGYKDVPMYDKVKKIWINNEE